MFASRIVLGQSIVKTLNLLRQSTGTEIVLVTIFYNLYKINKLCGRCSITFMLLSPSGKRHAIGSVGRALFGLGLVVGFTINPVFEFLARASLRDHRHPKVEMFTYLKASH